MKSLSVAMLLAVATNGLPQNALPVTTPITTETVGRRFQDVTPAVFRINNLHTQEQGTGFLHSSGVVITAAHVVRSAKPNEIEIVDFALGKFSVVNVITDESSDLAVLEPSPKIIGPIPIGLSARRNFTPGVPVETWGYPGGYNGAAAMLVVGYIAGIDDRVPLQNGTLVTRLVINAAFNSGNSGGPILDVEDGKLIGVVTAKLAPIPKDIESALDALKKQDSGMVYSKSTPGGNTEKVSEAQVVAMVLAFLRTQTQLVVGHAASAADLRNLLQKHGLAP